MPRTMLSSGMNTLDKQEALFLCLSDHKGQRELALYGL